MICSPGDAAMETALDLARAGRTEDRE